MSPFKRPELEKDVIRCPGCGALLDRDAETCPHCGARLEWSDEGDERRPRLVAHDDLPEMRRDNLEEKGLQ